MYIEEEKRGELENGEVEMAGVVEKAEKSSPADKVVYSGGSSGKNAIVVLDVRRVMVGVGARALFYPTLLYNVVRNKIQVEFRWWDWIDEVYQLLSFLLLILFVVLALVYTLVMNASMLLLLFPVYVYTCSELYGLFKCIYVIVQMMSVCFNSCSDKVECFCI